MTGTRTPAPPTDLLSAGRAALAEGAWADARHAFEVLVKQDPAPEAHAGLGEALSWLGETNAAIRCQERAYAAFRRRPDPLQSGLAAISLYFLYRVSLGNAAAARGWLSRAARIVAEDDIGPLAGWILLLRAHAADDCRAARVWARHARRMARRFGDRDLELCALSQLGAALVEAGHSADGTSLLDEAMAAALAGEGDRLHTVVFVGCNVIGACAEIAEMQRAAQWIRAADDFTRRYGAPHLYTQCRIYYGAALFATGDWAGAERELTSALRAGVEAEPALYGETLARLAELRLAQGRLEEAERLIEGYEQHSASVPVVAALRFVRGQAGAAEHIACRRLTELAQRERRPGPYRMGAAVRLEAACLLELLTVARLERSDAAAARETARELGRLASHTGFDAIRARAQRVIGRFALATMPDAEHVAVPALEHAVAAFGCLGMPYEAARTRLLLAAALRDREAAGVEAATAFAAFETLGAARDADEAAALLRSLGAPATRGRAANGELTRREREVLELLGEGLSNRELAQRLFVTPKTVEHHVHAVLSKLGLRSRAEAAVYAVRHRTRAAN